MEAKGKVVHKVRVGILGATGMVGQRFVSMLHNHPWFEVACLAASARSAGITYGQAVEGRWKLKKAIPEEVKEMNILDVESDFDIVAKSVNLVFSALNMDKERVKRIEERYAEKGVAVVSNNSSNRWTSDIPMVIPEINPDHLRLIEPQRKKRGWSKGFIVVKPNCSLQSYVPVLHVLRKFKPRLVEVTTLQAISGSGKTFADWPEMVDNVIPFISGEEEKTEREPLKILGDLVEDRIKEAENLQISATCIRVPVTDGHMASVSVKFENKPTFGEIVEAIHNFNNPLSEMNLPSSPKQFIKYFFEDDRPQTDLDRDLGEGMTVSCGRFREDPFFDWKFVSLSHNTIRGAAGGAILIAELLYKKGYLIIS
ncbi:aspartate-semialdehyde dehydrogenase [Patescibacteria group bacterium]|nr:aspartate-semialdehyde dehydrogenase [Patescibacteria group bacterium]MCL5797913.1 aspartate-semialdehyde dehydrogenase [Patescibacteria group bacterium]